MEQKQETKLVSFIPADSEEAAASEEEVERVYQDEVPYSDTAVACQELSELASSGDGVSRLAIPRDPVVRRKRVVTAFHDAFELIGGVPRLAHWADQHPTDFFKLYARLLPVEASRQISDDESEIRIIHAVPRSSLDE